MYDPNMTFTMPINISKTYNNPPAKDIFLFGIMTFVSLTIFSFLPVLTDNRTPSLDKIFFIMWAFSGV